MVVEVNERCVAGRWWNVVVQRRHFCHNLKEVECSTANRLATDGNRRHEEHIPNGELQDHPDEVLLVDAAVFD